MYFYNYGGIYDRGNSTYGSQFPDQMLAYWTRSLFMRATVMLDFENLPEGWDKDAFRYGLFKRGFLVVFESKKYGIVIQPGVPAGYGLQAQPTHVQVCSPYFSFTRPLRIGTECYPIKLTPDFTGIWDIITKYADELRHVDLAMRSGMLTARNAWALAATDDKSARTLKAIAERLKNGETAIIYDQKQILGSQREGDEPWKEFNADLKSNFILPDLENVRRMILQDFYKEIGVRVSSDKRERLITDEIEANDQETFIRREVWMQSLRDSIDKVNALFGTNIQVTVKTPEMMEGGVLDVV